MDNFERHIDVLVFDGVNVLDVTGPVQVFSSAQDLSAARYVIRYVSLDGAPARASCGLVMAVDGHVDLKSGAQDLIVPGGAGVNALLEEQALKDVISQWCDAPGRRLISVCSGAGLLANAGVLDGRTATTHWRRAAQFARLFPSVDWQTDRLYCDTGNVMTAAGVTSGIDLSLAIVSRDCGAHIALRIARELVVFLHRPGGQNQFADVLTAQFAGGQDLRRLVDAMIDQPQRHWTLETMADIAGTTPRTLTRRFTQNYAMSPVKFLERLRVNLAETALGGGATTARASAVAGFRDFQQMQRAFKRHKGTTVGDYQKRFVRNASI